MSEKQMTFTEVNQILHKLFEKNLITWLLEAGGDSGNFSVSIVKESEITESIASYDDLILLEDCITSLLDSEFNNQVNINNSPFSSDSGVDIINELLVFYYVESEDELIQYRIKAIEFFHKFTFLTGNFREQNSFSYKIDLPDNTEVDFTEEDISIELENLLESYINSSDNPNVSYDYNPTTKEFTGNYVCEKNNNCSLNISKDQLINNFLKQKYENHN